MASFVMESLNRSGCKLKGILPKHRGDCGLEILDLLTGKGGPDHDLCSNETDFFCGSSPPVRLSNPAVHGEKFAIETLTLAAASGNTHKLLQPSVRVERPSCGSSSGLRPNV